MVWLIKNNSSIMVTPYMFVVPYLYMELFISKTFNCVANSVVSLVFTNSLLCVPITVYDHRHMRFYSSIFIMDYEDTLTEEIVLLQLCW